VSRGRRRTEDDVQRERFVASRKPRWEELETLLKKAGGSGLDRLTGEEVFRAGQLYRVITSDLAIARRDFPHDRVTAYLNGLVGRAHPKIYQSRGASLGRVGQFVRYGFPAVWRQAAPYTLVAFLLSVIPAVIAAALVLWKSSMADVLVPDEAQALRSIMEQHHLWIKSATEQHSVVADEIITNNIQVAFYAFIGGATLGLLTAYVMVTNGINIGAVGAMVWQYHLSQPFWAFVAPHGAIELSVIFMAGGAGFMFADKILRPGLKRRLDAMVEGARLAGMIALGGAALLIIAGMFEAFTDPSDIPDGVKFAMGAINLTWLYAYLVFSRPRARQTRYRFEEALTAQAPSSPLGAGVGPAAL
jgi:uncharacterized membrane protein SpoIIM required for sporulation